MTSELAQYSKEVARPPTSAPDGVEIATAFWLLYRAASHLVALPMPHVVEIMRMLPIKQLSGVPPMVRGLCIIRGALTPVIDTALLFGDQPTACERLVTVRTGKRTIAVATEAVLGVREIPVRELEKLPRLPSDVQTIAAMKIIDQELVFFLHSTRLVSDEVVDRCLAEGAQA